MTPDPLAMAETLMEPFEGFCNRPYRCPAGVWTIGLGSTRDGDGNPVTPSTPPIDLATARGWAMRDMRAALTSVRAGVTVPLTANEEAALTDFVYNVGAGNFAKSNVLRDLNAGRLQQAADDRFGEETYYAKVDTSLPERLRRWERKSENTNGAE